MEGTTYGFVTHHATTLQYLIPAQGWDQTLHRYQQKLPYCYSSGRDTTIILHKCTSMQYVKDCRMKINVQWPCTNYMLITDLHTRCDMQSGDTIKTTNAQQPPHNQQSNPDVD